jgi:hypothetical protein
MKHRAAALITAVMAGLSAALLQGCATPTRLNAVPPEATAQAEIPGMAGVRYVLPYGVPAMLQDAQQSLAAERKARRRHQEMHVDGGAFAQVFVYPASLNLKDQALELGAERVRTLYLIRNSKVAPDWSEVERKTLSIAQRAVVSLIQTQGIGDLFRIYAISQRDEVDFNLAYIPDGFNAPHREEFDTGYMRALFDVGYGQALEGYPWAKAPPGM